MENLLTLLTRMCHTILYELPRQFQFLFFRKISVEFFCFVFIDKISLRSMIDACHTIQETRFQLLCKKIRDFLIPGFCVIVYTFSAGNNESRFAIEVYITLHAYGAGSKSGRLFQRIVKKLLPIPFSLILRKYTYRAESHYRQMSAVITDDLSFHIYDLSYQLPVLFHNEVQFRNEVRIVPIAMEHIMFQTSRPVNISECLSREILSLSVVSRCLRTNDDILFFQFIIPPLYDSVLSNLYGCSFSKNKSELSFTTLHFSKR